MKKIVLLCILIILLSALGAKAPLAKDSDVDFFGSANAGNPPPNRSLDYSKERIQDLEKSAKTGSAEAYISLGEIYTYYGYSKYNPKKAFKYYEKAVENGDYSAYIRMGDIRRYSAGKKARSAVDYYQLGVDKGLEDARLRLAELYIEGRVVEKDYKKAQRLLDSIDLDSAELASPDLVEFYKATLLLDGLGVDARPKEALKVIEDLAEKELTAAMLKLGHLYLKGKQVPRDQVRAEALFSRMANMDDGANKLSVALTLIHDERFELAKNLGMKLMRELAEEDMDAEAQFMLGQCYLQEEGKYCDFVEAAAWFATAYHNESNDMTKAGMRIYNMICAHLDNAKRWDLQQKESNYKRLYSKK
ncbi:MAG: sel1 repeat family protein [Candidatus Cloacimonetes bacterium]|jgi:TPR repeat protein|nr:sel1 repeat family protein [Candidatus Cloacimonadota bacterium]MDY0173042.1 tetratricopeptide repeat protein [Candidatus Cloacimonadaceae bacterium]